MRHSMLSMRIMEHHDCSIASKRSPACGWPSLLTSICSLQALLYGMKKCLEFKQWSMPYFEKTRRQDLLSNGMIIRKYRNTPPLAGIEVNRLVWTARSTVVGIQ